MKRKPGNYDRGERIDRSKHVNLNELFEWMSREELETYAREGKLPPVGSPESRAAARMLARNRQDTRRRIGVITNVHMPWPRKDPDPDPWNDEEPHIGPWRDCGDVLMRFVYVLDGMSDDQLRKDVGF